MSDLQSPIHHGVGDNNQKSKDSTLIAKLFTIVIAEPLLLIIAKVLFNTKTIEELVDKVVTLIHVVSSHRGIDNPQDQGGESGQGKQDKSERHSHGQTVSVLWHITGQITETKIFLERRHTFFLIKNKKYFLFRFFHSGNCFQTWSCVASSPA